MFNGFEAIGFSGISEAPEDRFLAGGSASMLVDWEILIYAATQEFITRPLDVPADQSFKGTLQKAFRIDRSVISADRIGEQITIGLGEVTLTNLEGDYDFLAIDHTPQGQRIVIKMGDPTKRYTWRTVLDGYMIDQTIDREQITFRLRDAGHVLDVPLSVNLYAGTGGTEGTSDLKDKSKPRWFGWNREVSPVLVIPSALAYQLNDGPIHQVQNVYVRGVALTFAADYASVAAMNAASITVGYYASCLAAGWIRIAVAGGTEIGQVTVNFGGDKAGGVFVETTVDIVRRILSTSTVLEDPTDLVQSTFVSLNAAQPAPIGYGVPAGSTESVAQSIANVMAAIGGWCGAKRSGKFGVWRLEAPSGTSCGTYDKGNVADVKTMPMPGALSPPPWRIKVGYARIWTPSQTDLAGSVTDTRRAFLAQEIRFAAAENETVKADFPPGHEWVKDQTYFRDEGDAAAEGARLGNIFWKPRALYVVPLSERLFIHELGQVVTLQYDGRLDLDEPKKVVIVKLSEDDANGVELTAMG